MVHRTPLTNVRGSMAGGGIVALVAAISVAFIAMSNVGCSRGSGELNLAADGPNDSLPEAGSWQGTPQDLLMSVFSRYRSAETYHDDGQVRLSYQSEGRQQSELAPLRVWLDRGILDVAAYDIRIRQGHTGSGGAAMTAWFVDLATNQSDSQVLQKLTNSGRPNLELILTDLVLADRLQAGLAGPPPQMEWLLADEPMKRLFDDQHRFEYAASEVVEGQRCHVVRVDASGDRYQFWIDQKQGVIRRVELPLIHLPAVASTSSTMKLTLELSGATFGSPKESLPPAPLPKRPRFVTQFIPLPPIEPSRILGSRPDANRLADLNGQVVLDLGTARDKILVLGRFIGGEASIANVALLQNWNSRLPTEISTRLQTTVVVDGSAINQVPSELTLPLAIDRDEIANRQLALMPGGLTILDKQGRIAWLQPQVTPDSLVAAGTIIGDLIQGIDVPGRLRQQWQQDVQAYQDAVNEFSIGNPQAVP